jgi:hypothetical protein
VEACQRIPLDFRRVEYYIGEGNSESASVLNRTALSRSGQGRDERMARMGVSSLSSLRKAGAHNGVHEGRDLAPSLKKTPRMERPPALLRIPFVASRRRIFDLSRGKK